MDFLSGYLDSADAAKALRRSVVTLERWRRLRRGPPFYVIEGRPLYKADELRCWIESSRRDPLPKGAA